MTRRALQTLCPALLAVAASCVVTAPPPPPRYEPGAPRTPEGPADHGEEVGEPDVPGREGDDPWTAESTTEATGRTVLEEANHLFAGMTSTRYAHHTVVDLDAGRFELDCSGFVGFVLGRAHPEALAELRAATRRRPLAKHFVAHFQALPARSAWRPIARGAELAPGDVLAWLKPGDVISKNTGHVMIVRGVPRRHPEHDDLWIVPVIDSTAVPHGRGDSRKVARVTGLGTGEVLLVVDTHDRPIGYRWSTGTKARVHHTTVAAATTRQR